MNKIVEVICAIYCVVMALFTGDPLWMIAGALFDIAICV